MVFKLSLLYNIEHKSYLALSFGRTHVIGIGGIPIIATPFITLEKYFLLSPVTRHNKYNNNIHVVSPIQTVDDEYSKYMQLNL